MKYSLLLLMFLACTSLSAQGVVQNDPYWEFDKSRHYKPVLNKAKFYTLTGFDFGWFVLDSISRYTTSPKHDLEKGENLSYGQKALFYWWYMYEKVGNGGFVLFYRSDCGRFVSTIIKGLEHIGDEKMAALIRRADLIYQKNKVLIDQAKNSEVDEAKFESQVKELSRLDNEFYLIQAETMAVLEKYIRLNPTEFCSDDEGNDFKINYTGVCKSYYAGNKLKEEFQLLNGKMEGEFVTYFENGQVHEMVQYRNGERTGERTEWYPNGKTKHSVRKSEDMLHHLKYFENGVLKISEFKSINGDFSIGPYKEWYENGQLAKTGAYLKGLKRTGKWLEFYPDGSKKLEMEYVGDKTHFYNFWNERGEQTLVDGNGYHDSGSDTAYMHHAEFKNYLWHGKQISYTNGIISSYSEMENGEKHGITRSFFKNGKVKDETIFHNGKFVSIKQFTLFTNPRVEFKIRSKICSFCYKDQVVLYPPDKEPLIKNKEELEKSLKVDKLHILSYSEEHVCSYSLFVRVDKEGNVMDVKSGVASNLWLKEEIEKTTQKLKFEVAYSAGSPTEAIYQVTFNYYLVD
jgi:antitoxin component YwqK of YwqJK toxin-antitoxin module